jgi:pyruvate formate lyase activating enzyme
MTCSFCQNYEISQNKPATEFMSIERLIEIIPTIENNAGVAFTYNEPLMWYEYVLEASQKIKQHNKDTSIIVVTNGYLNEKPLMKLLPYVDAMNIDLKGYTNRFYNKVCGATLEPVLETIKRCSSKCHIEITTLLVSDENDSLEEVRQIAGFLAGVNENIPLHLSRYFPRYKMQNEATKVEKMLLAQQEAQKYLKYVYVGNVGGIDNNTYCPKCNALLVKRTGYSIDVKIKDSKCSACGEKINIIL